MKFVIVSILVLTTGVLAVFGAHNAQPADFKYQAGVFVPSINKRKAITKCAGSVIHNEWILTAASCFFEGNKKKTTVIVGFKENNQFTYVRNALKVITHEKYSKTKQKMLNDIALIKIQYVDYGDYLQRIPLSHSASFNGQMVTVAGWSLTGNTATTPTNLQFTTLKVLSKCECKVKSGRNISKRQFCTLSTKRESCFGESGNAAVIGFGSNATQVGVLSHGLSDCSPNTPDSYTRVFSFLPWISRKTNIEF